MKRALAAALALAAWTPRAEARPVVAVLGEGERLHEGDEAIDLTPASSVELEAMRGETVAFQIAVSDPDAPIDGLAVDVGALEGERATRLVVEPFVEHFVEVRARSRNDGEPGSSLAFTAASRPPDDGVLGRLPDALLPVDVARCRPNATRAWCPYPLAARAGGVAAMWFDVFVPEDAAPGAYATTALVSQQGRVVARLPVRLRVRPATLPRAAVSFFAYYDRDSLAERFEDPDAVERHLSRMLHADRVDAVTALTTAAAADRIHDALTGALFTPERGYRGPGEGRAPEIAILGAYGSLGAPSNASARLAIDLARKIPDEIDDLFLYAVDEQCESPLGPDWKRALASADAPSRLKVGHTCGRDPASQNVDVVMMPADAVRIDRAEAARAAGKKVFVYNGRLPFAGPLMLDVPLASLTADGWIAASYDVDRWFFWETIFWNDSNKGGRGPRDVFADPETFHNADGDACLGDGLLIYPGKQPAFAAHSLDADTVFPSMRLASLRRGVEDAGLLALAASIDRDRALAVDRGIVGAALDEADPGGEPAFVTDAATLANARAELRSIVGDRDIALDDRSARAALASMRARRRWRTPIPRAARSAFEPLAAIGFVVIGWIVAAIGRRKQA